MARTRERARGRRSARGERFALLPLEVLEHPSCTSLSGAEFRVLVLVAAGFNGVNNGTLACTQLWAQRFGITGTDTARKALAELERRGLVEVTRPGARLRKVPTLYALSWQPIHSKDGQPLATPALPSWRFRNWQSADPAQKGQPRKPKTPIAGVNPKKLDPDPRGTVTPLAGVKGADYTPKSTVEPPVYTPRSGDTLRILERERVRGPQEPGAGAACDPRPLAQRIDAAREMLRRVPDLRDADLKSIAGLTAEQVKELRNPASDAPEAIP